ncbi:hypothetical protein J3F84DRAFT_308558 [Trichoderma pleuroticola]
MRSRQSPGRRQMARPCRIKALTEGRAAQGKGHGTPDLAAYITQPKQQLAKDTMTTLLQGGRGQGPIWQDYTQFGIHGRRARKYRPLGDTLGNGADSSALQVPMLTNFISMHCTSLGTSKRHGIAFAPALQKNHTSAASPVYAPAKPAAPSLWVYFILFYSILSSIILYCCPLGVGKSSPCLCPSDSVGRMVRELKQFNCHSAVTSAKSLPLFFFSLSRHLSPAHATGPAVVDRNPSFDSSYTLHPLLSSTPPPLLLCNSKPIVPCDDTCIDNCVESWCASALSYLRDPSVASRLPLARSLFRIDSCPRRLGRVFRPRFPSSSLFSLRLHRSDSLSFQR